MVIFLFTGSWNFLCLLNWTNMYRQIRNMKNSDLYHPYPWYRVVDVASPCIPTSVLCRSCHVGIWPCWFIQDSDTLLKLGVVRADVRFFCYRRRSVKYYCGEWKVRFIPVMTSIVFFFMVPHSGTYVFSRLGAMIKDTFHFISISFNKVGLLEHHIYSWDGLHCLQWRPSYQE